MNARVDAVVTSGTQADTGFYVGLLVVYALTPPLRALPPQGVRVPVVPYAALLLLLFYPVDPRPAPFGFRVHPDKFRTTP